MIAQEIFTTATKHLLKQGARAETEDPRTHIAGCMYRAPDGKKCAVGCLIPDKLYDPRMEKKGVSVLLENFPNLPKYFEENLELLKDLQDIHDDVEPRLWREALIKLAHKTGLKFPEGV